MRLVRTQKTKKCYQSVVRNSVVHEAIPCGIRGTPRKAVNETHELQDFRISYTESPVVRRNKVVFMNLVIGV
jgi:hypothetical protein